MPRRSRFRVLRKLVAVLAAVGVLAAPLRLWAECPMLAPDAAQLAEQSGAHDAHDAHSEHSEHAGHGAHQAASEPSELPTRDQAPSHDICLDFAHCTPAAQAVAVVRLGGPVPQAEDPGSVVPLAHTDVARTLEPPPPKRR